MGNYMIEGGGRRHGFQILKERAGSYPVRGFSLQIEMQLLGIYYPQR